MRAQNDSSMWFINFIMYVIISSIYPCIRTKITCYVPSINVFVEEAKPLKMLCKNSLNMLFVTKQAPVYTQQAPLQEEQMPIKAKICLVHTDLLKDFEQALVHPNKRLLVTNKPLSSSNRRLLYKFKWYKSKSSSVSLASLLLHFKTLKTHLSSTPLNQHKLSSSSQNHLI